MNEKPGLKKGLSADWFLQGALSKIGDAFDKFTGRNWVPSSSLATSELIERMKRLIDSEAKTIEGKGTVVPHNIRLKIQWDKFSTDSDEAIKKLENELLAAAADHINDSLYYTYAPLSLVVKPDYFTEGVKLFVSFEKFSGDESEAQLNVTVPSIKVTPEMPETAKPEPTETFVFIARFEIGGSRRDRRFELAPGGRLSVGRTSANDLVIDDPSVSKIHASVVVDPEGTLSVADTGSTNGTFINGERISYGKANRLEAEDRVKFGVVEVQFEKIAAAETTDAEVQAAKTGVSLPELVDLPDDTSRRPGRQTSVSGAEKTVEIDPAGSASEPKIETNVVGEERPV